MTDKTVTPERRAELQKQFAEIEEELLRKWEGGNGGAPEYEAELGKKPLQSGEAGPQQR